jgi:hypothetical protein
VYVENPVTGNYGVDVAGSVKTPAPQPAHDYCLVTQSQPIPVLFQGWLLNGVYEYDQADIPLGFSVQSFLPEPQFIPADDPSPGDGYRYVVVRLVTPGGWPTELASDYYY